MEIGTEMRALFQSPGAGGAAPNSRVVRNVVRNTHLEVVGGFAADLRKVMYYRV